MSQQFHTTEALEAALASAGNTPNATENNIPGRFGSVSDLYKKVQIQNYLRNPFFANKRMMFTESDGLHSFNNTFSGITATKAWFSLPYSIRCKRILSGATQYLPKLYFLNAVIVNGTTNTELQAALDTANTSPITAAQEFKVVYFTADITIAADVTIPSDVILVTPNQSKIISAGTSSILLAPNSTIACCVLECRIQLATTTLGASRAKIIGCKWTANPVTAEESAITDSRTSDNTQHKNLIIALNESVGTAKSLIWAQFMCDCIIEYNKWSYQRGQGRGIRAVGGINNVIRYNLFADGISGVGVLLDRSQSIGWVNNTIYGNEFKNFSEEATSLDCYGNTASKMAIWDRFDITSSGGSWSSNPVLNFTRTDATGLPTSLSAAAILVLNGTLAGRYLNVVQRNGTAPNFSWQLRNRSITAAELTALGTAKIALVVRCENNSIRNNFFEDCKSPIKLWGSGWNNEITGNVCVYSPTYTDKDDVDIYLQGVGELSPDSSTLTGTISLAPSGNKVWFNDASVGFNGIAYAAQTNVESHIAAFPNEVDGNSGTLFDSTWKRISSPAWESTQKVSTTAVGTSAFSSYYANQFARFDFSEKETQENRTGGTISFNGTGSQTVFNIPHLLYPTNMSAKAPVRYSVNAASAAAASDFYVTSTTTHLVVTFSVAPASGTNNVTFAWTAET